MADGADDTLLAAMRTLAERQQRFQQHLGATLGVDAPGLATMNALQDGGAATPSELAARIGVSRAAMTLVLDRLEAAGHAARSPHPDDRRKLQVRAAPASEDAVARLVGPVIDALSRLSADLGDEQRRVVLDFLHEATAAFDAALAT